MKKLILALAFLVPAYAQVSAHTESVLAPKRYVFDANFALFEGTGWTRELIEAHVAAANAVFDQCGVRIGKVGVYPITGYRPPEDISGRRPLAENGTIAVRKQTMHIPQPVVHLVGKLSDTGPHTKAVFRVNAPPCEPELANTIWMPFDVNTQKYLDERKNSPYSIMAHEMTHLLTLDGQHNDERPRNQLSIWRFRTDLLTPAMCAQILESPFVREDK